ncbi:MAG: hypothetical protein ACOH1N_03030 [Lutibacter sp.]
MKLFLFNEIVPNDVSNTEILKALEDTIKQYKILKEKFPENIDGIITTTQLDKIILCDNFDLTSFLKSLKNKEIRGYAYSIFTKYPMDNYFETDSVLMEEIEYFLFLNEIKNDALYLKVVSNVNGIAFTLNLHIALAKNSLKIDSSDYSTFSIDNLFGYEDNTKHICEIIKAEEYSKLGNFEKLQDVLKNPKYSKKFENSFSKISKEIQDIIIESFETVIDNRAKGVDTSETLLRDVTPSKEKEISVKELKVRDPIAKRIYFSEINGKYYLASLEDKPLKDRLTKEQSSHIKNAVSKLKELIN